MRACFHVYVPRSSVLTYHQNVHTSFAWSGDSAKHSNSKRRHVDASWRKATWARHTGAKKKKEASHRDPTQEARSKAALKNGTDGAETKTTQLLQRTLERAGQSARPKIATPEQKLCHQFTVNRDNEMANMRTPKGPRRAVSRTVWRLPLLFFFFFLTLMPQCRKLSKPPSRKE